VDRICWLVVSDLHLYYKNFANRKNYAEELSSVKMYCWSLAEKYKQAGWDSVNLLLLGDVFHRGYQSTFSAVNDSDFFFIEESNPKKLQNLIRDLVTRRLPKFYNVNPKEDIFVLAPTQKGDLGVEHLNLMLQDALNSSTHFITYKSRKFKVNDKVMQIQNNYDKDIYNGDIGTISSIDFKNKTISVLFDSRKIKYKLEELDELNLAYAMTIHKSQGSEFPIVVLPLTSSYGIMLQKNLLYTAVTRAKQVLVIVGEKEAISLAISNNQSQKRNTKLKERLRTH